MNYGIKRKAIISIVISVIFILLGLNISNAQSISASVFNRNGWYCIAGGVPFDDTRMVNVKKSVINSQGNTEIKNGYVKAFVTNNYSQRGPYWISSRWS